MDAISNHPPSDIDILRERLEEEATPLARRRDELLASVDRAPLEITDDDLAGRTADLIMLIATCHKAAETQRVGCKEPFLEAGRAVDGFYKKITVPLEKAKRAIEQRLTAYQRKKADEERRRREEDAERQRLAAEEAAKSIATDADLDEAINAEADAKKAETAAEAKPAELSRSRGDLGAVASLRTEWTGEITDRNNLDLLALRAHIPLDALEKAVRSFVRAGGRELKGANIYERTSSVVR